MWWESWLDVALPRRCAGCRRPGASWCRWCSRALLSARPRLLPPPPDVGVLAVAGEHSGLLRHAILAHKQRAMPAMVGLLATLLARTLAVLLAAMPALNPARAVVVPVPPSSRRPLRLPVSELTDAVARASPDILALPVLRTVRRRGPQKGLDAVARAANVEGSMGVVGGARGRGSDLGPWPPWPVVVVDDVLTTGATMRAAISTLRASRLRPVGAVALAHARAP